MAKFEHLNAVRLGVAAVQEWRDSHPRDRLDLRSARLRGRSAIAFCRSFPVRSLSRLARFGDLLGVVSAGSAGTSVSEAGEGSARAMDSGWRQGSASSSGQALARRSVREPQ